MIEDDIELLDNWFTCGMVQIKLITKETQLLSRQHYITFSIPPREVTSTKSRCKSNSLPPMMGILQLKCTKNISGRTENFIKYKLVQKEEI
jgi:hypothetical protein